MGTAEGELEWSGSKEEEGAPNGGDGHTQGFLEGLGSCEAAERGQEEVETPLREGRRTQQHDPSLFPARSCLGLAQAPPSHRQSFLWKVNRPYARTDLNQKQARVELLSPFLN